MVSRLLPKASGVLANNLAQSRGNASYQRAGTRPQIKSLLVNAAARDKVLPKGTGKDSICLPQYAASLLQNGFDDIETLLEIEDSHMKDIGIPAGHQVKLKRRLRELKCASSTSLDTLQPTEGMLTLVQRSWLHVQEVGPDAVGEILYKKFFELVPESTKFFTMEVRARYKDWSTIEEEVEDDLYNSPAMRILWGKVVKAVGSVVAGLQDINRLVPQLRSLGMRHVGYGIPETYFEIGGKALARTLEDLRSAGRDAERKVTDLHTNVQPSLLRCHSPGWDREDRLNEEEFSMFFRKLPENQLQNPGALATKALLTPREDGKVSV